MTPGAQQQPRKLRGKRVAAAQQPLATAGSGAEVAAVRAIRLRKPGNPSPKACTQEGGAR